MPLPCRFWVRCLSALVLAACREPADTGLATPVIDTLSGGVVRVTNTGPTAWADTMGWYFVPERVIAPPEGSPGEIAVGYGLAMHEDGSVYLIQRRPGTIKQYGPDGRFVRDIGREGAGPGEFQVGYLGVHHDTLVLQDPGLYRLSVFTADGTLLGTHASLGDWATSFLDIDAAGRVAVPGATAVGEGYASIFRRMQLDGRTLDTLWLPDDPAPATMWRAEWVANGRSWNMRMPAPLQPRLLIRYDAVGRVVHGTTDDATLVLSRTGRDTLRLVHSRVPRVPVTSAHADSLFGAALRSMEWQPQWLVEGSRSDIPTQWPVWSQLNVDRRGNLWLGLPGPDGVPTRAQVFDSSGVLLGDVALPHRRLLNGTWGGDRVAVLDEDDEGQPIIRVYRLERRMRGN